MGKWDSFFALLYTVTPALVLAQPNPPTCQVARLLSPEAQTYDGFGWSVGISGDRVVVSAPNVGACSSLPYSSFPYCGGATFVYRREGDAWAYEAKLLPPGGPNYFAARSVGISGDFAVVSAPLVNPIGEALVFRRSGDDWCLGATLRSSDARSRDDFGRVVAINGDLMVASAYGAGCQSSTCLVAYVFRYNDNQWTEEGKLVPAGSNLSYAEISLAVDGNRVVMGFWADSQRCSYCGSAYIFNYANGNWSQEATLFAPEPSTRHAFGTSVDIHGDRLIVGATGDDDDCTCDPDCGSGAAFVYRRTGLLWELEQKLTSGVSEYTGFGHSVSLGGDPITLSGTLALVGSTVFQHSENQWKEVARLVDTDRLTGMASPSAMDGQHVIVGAHAADFAGFASGAAYIFRVLGLPDLNANSFNDSCEGDCNGNGVPDRTDVSEGAIDCNANGVPDECESDCNQNGRADTCDIALGSSEDCACNGIPDECEPDCNDNSFADSCDIFEGRSLDCINNGIPDECEPDCNSNGIADSCEVGNDCNHNQVPDSCDLFAGTSQDCSGDGVPDECDADCNENGVPDTCDVFEGTSPDMDFDHVPDECEPWSHCISAPGYFDYGPHRANAQAEMMALLAAGQLRAPDELYERIDGDMRRIEAAYPILDTVGRWEVGTRSMYVILDPAKTWDGFDELNEFYQATSIITSQYNPNARQIEFCDTLNIMVLRTEYAAIPEITYTEGGVTSTGNYNGDYITLERYGDIHLYKYANGGGDCPAGCTCEQSWQFATIPSGPITLISYEPGPAWCDVPNDGDFDGDGLIDYEDPCPGGESGGESDGDGDGVGDLCDACALTIHAAEVDAAGCPPDALGDIDQDGDIAPDDFGRLRNCLGGPDETPCGFPNIRPYLDSDWDVDLRDISIFQNCFSGHNVPADSGCFR